MRLLVVLVGPELRAAVRLELAPGSETARLAAMKMIVLEREGIFWRGESVVLVSLARRLERLDRFERAAMARGGGKKAGEGWQRRGNGRSADRRRLEKAAALPIASVAVDSFCRLLSFLAAASPLLLRPQRRRCGVATERGSKTYPMVKKELERGKRSVEFPKSEEREARVRESERRKRARKKKVEKKLSTFFSCFSFSSVPSLSLELLKRDGYSRQADRCDSPRGELRGRS